MADTSRTLLSSDDEKSSKKKSCQTGSETHKNEGYEKFGKFMKLCSSNLKGEEQLLHFMQKCFHKADPVYKNSREFYRLVTSAISKVKNDISHIYIHIKEFLNEIKAYKVKTVKKKRKHESESDKEPGVTEVSRSLNFDSQTLDDNRLTEETETSHAATQQPNNNDSFILLDMGVTEEVTENSGSCINVDSDIKVGEEPNPTREAAMDLSADDLGTKRTGLGSERQIQKLEKLLQDINKEIKRLNEQELDLDDLEKEDSAYLQIDLLQKRFNKTWQKLCVVKKRSTTTGRPTELRFHYDGSRYPEINRAIERFVNKKKIFPDFEDVLHAINNMNKKHNLMISNARKRDLAREVFVEVGDKLQERRHKDHVANFGSHLTDRFRVQDDPAMFDRDLKRKLERNKESSTKIDDVVKMFAHKQETLGDKSSSQSDNDLTSANEDILPITDKPPQKRRRIDLLKSGSKSCDSDSQSGTSKEITLNFNDETEIDSEASSNGAKKYFNSASYSKTECIVINEPDKKDLLITIPKCGIKIPKIESYCSLSTNMEVIPKVKGQALGEFQANGHTRSKSLYFKVEDANGKDVNEMSPTANHRKVGHDTPQPSSTAVRETKKHEKTQTLEEITELTVLQSDVKKVGHEEPQSSITSDLDEDVTSPTLDDSDIIFLE